MSATRSQKRRNIQQESAENVTAGLISPAVMENLDHLEQEVVEVGPSIAKFPRIENSKFSKSFSERGNNLRD